MAEYGELHCEPCLHENISKSASNWCTDCEESLCDDCCRRHKTNKMLKSHHIIPSDEYRKSKDLNVKVDCPDHRKQFDFYCSTHDSIVCVECVQLTHARCKDLRPLVEAAKGAKTSTALTDLEQTIDGLLENIDKGVRHLQQNKTNLKEQEDVRKKSIATKRAEINKHLDLLEEKLLKELKSKSEKAVKKISLMTTKLEAQRKHISDLKDTAQHMKQFSSDLQMYVGIRSILKTVVNEKNGIELLVNSIPQLSIAVQFNPKFDTFTEAFDSLGEIQIISKVAPVKLDNLQLNLRTTIKMGEKNSDVMSCLILPNKSIMIASWYKPSLTILKEDGSHVRDIDVPANPYDVTLIDDQMVKVSYGNTWITTVNISNQRTNKTVETSCRKFIWGITYNDGKLYAVAEGNVQDIDDLEREGIKVIDLDGNIIKTIRIYDDARNTHKVTTHKDKIYYSVTNGSVHCVDMEGTKIWTCRDDRLHTSSYYSPAIAVDNYGITFAAGFDNNLLLAISPDGKQQKVLLTSSDGLQKPNAVYYDKYSKRLLVCNRENGHAALYDVIY